jgi:hypothetical protein
MSDISDVNTGSNTKYSFSINALEAAFSVVEATLLINLVGEILHIKFSDPLTEFKALDSFNHQANLIIVGFLGASAAGAIVEYLYDSPQNS